MSDSPLEYAFHFAAGRARRLYPPIPLDEETITLQLVIREKTDPDSWCKGRAIETLRTPIRMISSLRDEVDRMTHKSRIVQSAPVRVQISAASVNDDSMTLTVDALTEHSDDVVLLADGGGEVAPRFYLQDRTGKRIGLRRASEHLRNDMLPQTQEMDFVVRGRGLRGDHRTEALPYDLEFGPVDIDDGPFTLEFSGLRIRRDWGSDWQNQHTATHVELPRIEWDRPIETGRIDFEESAQLSQMFDTSILPIAGFFILPRANGAVGSGVREGEPLVVIVVEATPSSEWTTPTSLRTGSVTGSGLSWIASKRCDVRKPSGSRSRQTIQDLVSEAGELRDEMIDAVGGLDQETAFNTMDRPRHVLMWRPGQNNRSLRPCVAMPESVHGDSLVLEVPLQPVELAPSRP